MNKAKNLVTVPDTFYHYVSNPYSTLKIKSPKITLDRAKASIDVISYAEEHNIKIPERIITKESSGMLKIKHFIERRDSYFCGIKCLSKIVRFDYESFEKRLLKKEENV